MPKHRHRECLHCKELFAPDVRNGWHQKFCNQPECRRASKAQSQRRWLSKPANQEYFRGSANVERVRQWRAKNPGYWKRPSKPPPLSGALQEVLPLEEPVNQEVAKTTSITPLQDVLTAQGPLLVGLIAHLIDSPLQENIEKTTLRLLEKGRNILNMKFGVQPKENTHANQQTRLVRATAAGCSAAI